MLNMKSNIYKYILKRFSKTELKLKHFKCTPYFELNIRLESLEESRSFNKI